MPQKLLILQSMWAMERRRPDGLEWPLDEKVSMIRAAGFDGANLTFRSFEYAKEITDRLKADNLVWIADCFPASVDDLRTVIGYVENLGALHINVLPLVRPYTLAEAIPYVEGWRRLSRESGIPVLIETHRNEMTTDLIFTLHLLDAFPDLQLTGDLSHLVVAREFQYPILEETHRWMHRILDSCWALQGRVASREQIQVQIAFPQHKHWVDLFLAWWDYGIRSWRRRAPKDATLTFLCELGPKEYAMTGADGFELSDRWQESLLMKGLIRDLWNKIEAEEGARAAQARP